MIRGYDGDVNLLGSTERYFAELIQIPHLAARLQSWAVKQRLSSQVLELSERQSKLSKGFDALVTSNGLHTALGLLLALGNTLNAGTARANRNTATARRGGGASLETQKEEKTQRQASRRKDEALPARKPRV